jgi:type II secretory pathway pseudopilin PulG
MLMAMLLVLAMTLVGAAALIATSKQLSSANAAKTSMSLSSCAQAVRQYLAAQQAAGSTGTLALSVPSTGAPITLQGGHYENIDTVNYKITTTAPSGFGLQTQATGSQNLAGALPMGIGGTAVTTTGVAVCTDPNGRTAEVEFSMNR